MPIITNNTIYKYSSEDPAFPAKNLLENNKTARWKCKAAGEKTAFVIIKLNKPYHIDKLDIGNEWSAFMEVLVANSKQDPPEFKELLLTSSFMTEKEARAEQSPNRIRFFEKTSMLESVAEQQWDLVKVICTQTYNTRKQFGIAFITLYTSDEVKSEEPLPTAPSVSIQKETQKKSPKATKKIGKFTFKDSSSDEEDKSETSPFQKWKMKKEASHKPDLKAQIKAKLIESRKRIRSMSNSSSDGDMKSFKPKAKLENRNRNKGLMYESDDDEPNERLQKKIDKDLEMQKSPKSSQKKPLVKSPTNKFASFISKKEDDNPSTSSKLAVPKKEPQYKPFSKLMEGVTFVLSGYQNPERATLRQKALDMGACYKGDWDKTCSHLICAFANTPKFNQVKGKGKIVTGKWIENCFSQQKRLPWRLYATDRDDKTGNVSEEEILCDWGSKLKASNDSDSDGDMLVVDNRKTDTKESDDDDMAVVVVKQSSPQKVEIVESENEEQQKENEVTIDSESSIDYSTVECEAFKNKIFYLNDDLPASSKIKYSHNIKHMLGIVTRDATKANYIITKQGHNLPKNSNAEVVKDTWIQECFELQAKLPTSRYRHIRGHSKSC